MQPATGKKNKFLSKSVKKLQKIFHLPISDHYLFLGEVKLEIKPDHPCTSIDDIWGEASWGDNPMECLTHYVR